MDKEEKVAVTTSYLPAVEAEHHGPESALPARIEDAAMADPTGAPQPSSQLLVTTSSKNQQPKENTEQPYGLRPAAAPAARETSEKKKAANRANEQKSTGPKTVKGKVNSRRNALKHCLLAQKALFDTQSKPQDEGYRALYLQLCDEFPGDDLVTQLRREEVLAAYWRLTQGLRYERELMERWGADAFASDSMPRLHRYAVANQKALAARLKELEEAVASSIQPAGEAPVENADEVEDELEDAATPMEMHDNQNGSAGVTAESTGSTPLDSVPDSTTSDDGVLPSSDLKEVAGSTERQNESLDQLAPAGPEKNGAIPPAGSLVWEEAESEDEAFATKPTVIQ